MSVSANVVAQELEVYYRWHPYFGCKVAVRRLEQRATGQFLKVQGPAGVVVSIAGWMLDPVICAAMAMGAPRVDLTALVELERLLIGAASASIACGISGADHIFQRAATRFMPLIHYAADQPARAGAGVSFAECTRFQSRPSSRAENCAADNRITPSSIFGQRNSPSSSRL